MSDEAESSIAKRTKYSEDDRKETGQKTGELNPSSSPLIPPGLSAEDLSIFYTAYERDIDGGLEDFVKQQQRDFWHREQIHSSFRKTSESSQKETEGIPECFKISDFGIYFSDSDSETEESGLIFELEISDTNRLVIPYGVASGHFAPLIKCPKTQEILQLTDPFCREWDMILTYDGDAQAYIITNGWNLYLEHYHLNPPDMIQVYLPTHQLHVNHFYIQHQKKFGTSVFEVLVPRSNSLPIPCHLAVNYFQPSEAPPPPDHLREYTLCLTDYLNLTWETKFICFEDEEAYIVFRGWEHYVANYGLNHKDTIRFFRQNPSQSVNSFVIYHEWGPEILESTLPDYIDRPVCLRDNLLGELHLSKADVESGRLEMPGFKMPLECRTKEMVKLTDENSKDWYVIIVDQSVTREYMILDGWEGIVREHELEARDTVRFYIPACPDHGKHFLIECAKKKKKMVKEEGGSGSRKPDNGAGQSRSFSRKGKEIAE